MSASDHINLTRWQRDRRALIEHRVYWHGSIGLADLMDVMEISRAQASKDINAYIADHPGHLFYDKSARTYVTDSAFEPHYLSLDPGDYLEALATLAKGGSVAQADWIVDKPEILTLSLPSRGLQPEIVRSVVQACTQGRGLEVAYQSMRSAEPSRRSIAPHAIAHDGFRWHARAYCLKDQIFKDFDLGRMIEAKLGKVVLIDPAEDLDWFETVTLRIAAHPGFSEGQRRIIELDYGMVDGVAELPVRKSLLFYNLKRLGLDAGRDIRAPQDQHIVLVNADEVFAVLGRKAP